MNHTTTLHLSIVVTNRISGTKLDLDLRTSAHLNLTPFLPTYKTEDLTFAHPLTDTLLLSAYPNPFPRSQIYWSDNLDALFTSARDENTPQSDIPLHPPPKINPAVPYAAS